MVDLVKIRKKANEKKEAEEGQTTEKETSTKAAAKSKSKAPGKRPARTAKSPEVTKPDKPAASPESGARKAAETDKAEAKPDETPTEAPQASAAAKAEPPASNTPEAAASEPVGEVEEAAPDATKGPSEPEPTASPAEAPQEPDEDGLDRLAKFKREAGKRRSWVSDATRASAGSADEEEESGDLELLRFRLAGEEYAVDIEKIVEIVPPRGTTRVPNADPTIVGIMSLRGTIVTVFDLRRKLGHPQNAETDDADRRLIVVEREGETAGFLVDKVSRVVKLDPSEIENHPVVSAAEQNDYLGGVFQGTDGLVILLDLEKILAGQG